MESGVPVVSVEKSTQTWVLVYFLVDAIFAFARGGNGKCLLGLEDIDYVVVSGWLVLSKTPMYRISHVCSCNRASHVRSTYIVEDPLSICMLRFPLWRGLSSGLNKVRR